MHRHFLSALMVLCILGLAAPAGARADSDTLFGEVTEILNPETALDWVVGTPVTVAAEWDTDDFIDMDEFGYPGLFLIWLGSRPRVSLTITLGSETWIESDRSFTNQFLLFDEEGDFLGPTFAGENSDGNNFGTSTFWDITHGLPVGFFFAGSPGPTGVQGYYDVPGWDGHFPPLPAPEPGSLALLGLGLLCLGLTRRRTN